MVNYDPVLVVADLGFVPEFDRLTEPAFPDRTGVGVVQTDPPSRTIGCGPCQPLAALLDDPPGRLRQLGQVLDRPGQPATPTARRRITPALSLPPTGVGSCLAQGTFRVPQQAFGLGGGGLRQIRQLPVFAPHQLQRLLPGGGAAGA